MALYKLPKNKAKVSENTGLYKHADDIEPVLLKNEAVDSTVDEIIGNTVAMWVDGSWQK